MKKSFMNNIKHFVDSNVRQRIDRAANNNNDFFGDDLLLVERQFEDMRHVCLETEKRISAMLQSLASSSLGAYTQNVQASLNNLSTNLSSSPAPTTTSAVGVQLMSGNQPKLVYTNNPTNETQFSTNHNTKQPNQSSRFKTSTVSITNDSSATTSATLIPAITTTAASNKGSNNQLHLSNSGLNDATVIREEIRRHKKLPIVGFLKFLVKSCHKLRPDSLLATTLTHCSQLQSQLTELYLSYEQTIELQCLKPIQHIIENDVPNVIRLRKLFIKSHNDLESVKAKYNGASQKQQQQLQTNHATSTSYTIAQTSVQQANINKLDQLRKELDDAVGKFEQARDTYATELYSFVCRETELVNLFMKFYQHQAEYQLQVGNIIQNSLPSLGNILANTPRKVVFGTPLEEHLRCTNRSKSLVIELCVHILHSKGLNEEGLFRIPGSSVKIKKLKNAINAWFVTLASQSELQTDRHSAHSSVLAVYDLFKEIVGQRPQQTAQSTSETNTNNQINLPARDDLVSTHIGFPLNKYQHNLVFDVHTIAGLLKLYLRELPEPLFTHNLYQEFLDATAKAVKDNCNEALERVIQKLPKANYDNLHHLIKFLHLLTCHRDHNKMTATNLAIAMAPSLIWHCPSNIVKHEQQATLRGGEQLQEDMQSLNLQMSSVGMSASLHALVIENLINNAEKLFPEQAQLSILGLDEAPVNELSDKIQQLSAQDRCIESSSPTGLSTASSSSFSSTSDASQISLKNKKHRKGGSMEGLLSNLGKTFGSNRPYSVQINQKELSSQAQQPPPVPPAPASRSHIKHISDTNATMLRPTTSQKPPAPPIPPSLNSRNQQYTTSPAGSRSTENTINETRTFSSLVQSSLASSTGSLRGTGTLRPSVPPPNRPSRATPEEKTSTNRPSDNEANIISKPEDVDNNPQGDSKSLVSSGNFRADFEEINAIDADDISVPSVSPIVSLDTISGDDSSFDNDCHSLEHSWTDCDLEPPVVNQTGGEPSNINGRKLVEGSSQKQLKLTTAKQVEKNNSESQEATSELLKDEGSPKTLPPPVKPPRSMSPKITQSTPL